MAEVVGVRITRVDGSGNLSTTDVGACSGVAASGTAAAVVSGSINVTNLGVFTWPLVLYPTPTVFASGPGPYHDFLLNNSPKLHVTSGEDVDLTGFASGGEGQLLPLYNGGSSPLTLSHAGAGSQSGNRLSFLPAYDYKVWPGEEVTLEYVGGEWVPAHPLFAAGVLSGEPLVFGCNWLQQGAGIAASDAGGGVCVFGVGSGGVNSGMLSSGLIANLPSAAGGGPQWNVRVLNASGVAAAGDFVLAAANSGVNISVTLPAGASNSGKSIAIKRLDGSLQSVTIRTSPGEVLDTVASLAIPAQNNSYVLVADGLSGWMIQSKSL